MQSLTTHAYKALNRFKIALLICSIFLNCYRIVTEMLYTEGSFNVRKVRYVPKYFSWKTSLASVQWLFFIFANIVVVPISIGTAFQLPAEEIAGILRSSLTFTGIACILQGWFGHRLPIMEGHSGVMWGLVLNLCISASSMGMSLPSIGGGIATGLLLSGITVIILGAFNLLSVLQKIFTPMVMSVYLFLLTFQLIFIFFEGMLKVSADGTLDLPVSLFSLALVVFVVLLKVKGKPAIGNFSILIGMVVGWILYVMIFPAESIAASGQAEVHAFRFPIFPMGTPNLNIAIVVITFLASLVNLSNTIASVQAATSLLREKMTQAQMNRSYVLTGFYSIVAGIFGLVAYAPFASSIGFLESSRIFDRKPFIISGVLLSLLGIIPILGSVLATLPVTVGNAVLFVAYLQLFGTSMKSLKGYAFNSVTIHRLAIPVLVGVCIMTMDAQLFQTVPALIRPLLSNGFMMGVLLSILLEKVLAWE